MSEQKKENSELEELKEKILKCEKERDEYLDGWRRAKADLINYKKDEIKRLEEMAKYLSEDIIMDLIKTLDNFDLGISALEKAGKAERGVYMVRSQLADILKKRGVSEISLKVGDKFDPSFAEAIAEAESDHPAGTIIEEIEKGYKLHDKVLRPVRVKVAKNK